MPSSRSRTSSDAHARKSHDRHGEDRLLIFARFPVAGRVKTRLVPQLDHEEAAALYRAFLLDAIERWSAAGTFQTVVCVADPQDVDAMAQLIAEELKDLPHRVAVRAQQGTSLGTRLLRAFEEAFDDGCARVCAIGSDHPTLPLRMLRSAFDRTAPADAVIGPTDDGGYWLIGMENAHAELLEQLPYSTPGLLDAVIERAASSGLRMREIGRWYDVDTAEDLRRVWSERRAAPPGARTATMLEKLQARIAERGVMS